LSGTFFPIRSFNFWVAAGASIIPLTLALDAIRQLSFASGADMGFLDVRVEVAILAGLCVMFLISARMLLQRLERLAIAEGRLTEARA
jgi:ABC-2 type transport system permease protein